MAYKGKFSSGNREPRFSDVDVQVTPRKTAAPKKEVYQEEAPVKRAPTKEVYSEETPVKKTAKKSSKKKKKANPTITVIFYTFYFLLIIGFFGGMFFVTEWLEGWLTDYEASQPTAKCEEVFARLFGDPDWAAIYAAAGIADSDFEGAEDYVSYMEKKVGDTELTYAETSAGLTGGHKYLIKLDDETLGYFTLTDQRENLTDLPDWQLGEVVMNVTRGESVLVQCMEGHTVTVNGVALDDSHVIKISSTLAENYLPGSSGIRTHLLQVNGLMDEPEIVITDEEGTICTVAYNEETGIYEEQSAANTMGPEEKERALKTAETYALHMIEEAGGTLSRYFDTTSAIYKTITSIDPWMQGHSGYEFANEAVSDYCRYGDDLFSAHVSLSLNVTRSDGSVKEYTVDHTFFFEMQSGAWKCFNMTNVDITEAVSSVRLTFMSDDTVISSDFYDSNITELDPPDVSVPEGQVFAGWYKETLNSDGSITYDVIFTPDENGDISIPTGTTLEPMTLYPLFEAAAGGTE